MTDTQALIARLEQATGPDRELDAAIAVATTPGMFEEGGFVGFTGKGDMEPPPAFTASIDIALTLVPEIYRSDWCLGFSLGSSTAYLGVEWRDVGLSDYYAFGATPALAIVSAAIRAKGDA